MRNREVPPKAGGTTSVQVLGEARRSARPGLVHKARDTAERALRAERGRHPSRSRARRAFPQRDRRSHCHSQPSLCSRSAEFQRTRDERKRLGKKKIDPLSSLSRQERRGPKSAPRKGPTRKRPSLNGNRSRTAHGDEAELGRPLMDWGASRLTREGGAIRLTILNRKCLRDSPSRPGSVSVGTAPGRRGRRGQVSAAARCCPWCGAGESGVQAAPE